MKKFLLAILFLGAAAGLTWLVWFRPPKAEEEEKAPEAEVPVHVAKIQRATLHSYVTAYGVVEPEPAGAHPAASARVAAPAPGVIAVVKCVEGHKIEAGGLLFQLDSRAADAAAEKAQRLAEFAEKTLERQKKLLQVDGASQKTVLEAEQAFTAARNDLTAAQTQQALLRIVAPLAGTVVRVNARPGEAVDLANPLVEIIDLDRLVITANIPSAELASVRPGQPAEISSADTTNTWTSSLLYSSGQVDPRTGAATARLTLPAQTGLRPGQFVKVRVATAEHRDCTAVPIASVARDAAGATFVALVDGDKSQLKPVKVGLREGDLVEVEGEGVEPDKTVVTEGAYGLVMTQQFATKIRVVEE